MEKPSPWLSIRQTSISSGTAIDVPRLLSWVGVPVIKIKIYLNVCRKITDLYLTMMIM